MQHHEPRLWHLGWKYVALAARTSSGSASTDRKVLITAEPDSTRLEATNGWGWLAAVIPTIPNTGEGQRWRRIITCDDRTNHVADESNKPRGLAGIGAEQVTIEDEPPVVQIALHDSEAISAQPRIVDEEYPTIWHTLKGFTPGAIQEGPVAPERMRLFSDAGVHSRRPNIDRQYNDAGTEMSWRTSHRDYPDLELYGLIVLKA